ncbi:nuclear transport factor 2 family protein [Arsenicicoccus dermatophilus]|uniref:nuclear transport factor 2 family protein n=1 Tax=Arsenicicoccus dermatophilus TaxID=1076331 RepID=UPI00391754DC
MTDTGRSDQFAAALQQLEQGDRTALLDMFADGARLQRPQQDHVGAEEDAETFWEQYLAQFDTVSTTFDQITEAGDLGVLEWRSTGTLASGHQIDYAGVSLLHFEGRQVVRFATYYDTAAFASAQ